MSAENKTRFEVQKILRDNILAGLAASGISAAEFTVMEAGQTIPTSKHDVILFKLESTRRVGWQAVRYGMFTDDSGNAFYGRADESNEEQSWLISVLKQRRPSAIPDGSGQTQITSLMSEDVAQRLIFWFNGHGCDEFRKSGMANLVISEQPINMFKSSSSVFERSSSFTLKLRVPKRMIWDQKSGRIVFDGVYGI